MYSAYSALTKIRSRYGAMFTYEQYQELMSCKSVSEIASYLKATDGYSKLALPNKEACVHRGVLEANLRHLALESNIRLCLFEQFVGEHFYEYIIEQEEVTLILGFLRHISSGDAGGYYIPESEFFYERAHIDFDLLSRAESYSGFLQAFSGSKYYPVISPFISEENKSVDFSALERALYEKLFSDLYSLIKKYNSKKSARELSDLLSANIELKNISLIYRMKKYFKAKKEDIMLMILPFHGKLSKTQIEQLLDSNPDDINKVILNTPYRDMALDTSNDIETAARKILFKKCSKTMRFSINPHAVTLSYLFLLEIEIQNIVIITEGIRYSLPNEEIQKMLVY